MSIYHEMKKDDISKAINLIEELSMKFPMSKIGDFDLKSLAEYYKVNKKSIESVYVLLDFIRKTKAYIKLEDIKSIRVKRKEKEGEWVFLVKNRVTKGIVTLIHPYSF